MHPVSDEKKKSAGKEVEMQVSAKDVNLDFIMEERARELVGEKFRRYDLKKRLVNFSIIFVNIILMRLLTFKNSIWLGLFHKHK
jgi:uncharacterized membrane protein SpoIIM required for sporulation